jgi:uncharacterized repeat protein (TIGR03803 family)
MKAYIIAILVITTLTIAAVAQPVGQVSPTNLNFEPVLLGRTSAAKVVALKNIGDASLTVYSLSITGPFAITKNTCEGGIKTGTHCNVWVTYTPQPLESETGTLTFTDDATNSPQTVSLSGPNYDTFYRFTMSSHAAFPTSGAVVDSQGNVYGTTEVTKGTGDGGPGTVFKLTPSGSISILHVFGSPGDGNLPNSLMIGGDGNLYGTTLQGTGNGPCCGNVFRLTLSGTYTVLYSFGGQLADGAYPNSVIMDAQGNLYGTTEGGGDLSCSSPSYEGCGTVFKLTPGGTETVLYSFGSQSGDGVYPYGLVIDQQGNLFGTTAGGGDPSCYSNNGCGTVFKVTPSGQETVLYSFTGSPDAAFPVAAVILDAEGNLYGTTQFGGSCYANIGCGTVFKVTPSGQETVLYSFCSEPSCSGGSSPQAALVMDAWGNLYGTASGGEYDYGTVFQVSPNGTETVLYSFTGEEDGRYPITPLNWDAYGNLWGTTTYGPPQGKGVARFGTVFWVIP